MRLPLLLTFSMACLLAACSKDADANANAGANAANQSAAGGGDAGGLPDDSDCNLQTVLDPNKPGSPGNLIPSERNPNGDSELAVLMRRFIDDLRDAQVLVEAGEKVKPLYPVHRTMRCAWPTNPAERNEGYDGRAQSYLASVRAFDAAPSKDTYNGIVGSCVACHQINCSGVIDLIEGLRWE